MGSFDLVIIGAGPGGYVAAIRAAQLGAKVALVERDRAGGVCLNRGCIPTKALIASAHALEGIRRAAEFGVAISGGAPSIDLAKAHGRKEKIVADLRGGIERLLRGNRVELIAGTAKLTGPGKLAVDGNAIDAKRILIATGSTWIDLPGLPTDGRAIVTSDEALGWTEVPRRLAIVGGGVIGCEFACMMRAFGAEVSIVEATPSILPPVEKAVSRLLARAMKARGIEILTNTTVARASADGDAVRYTLSTGEEREADRMIVAVGRRPMTKGLNLESAGIELTERGFIRVDGRFQTTAKEIFAIGDVIGHPMLAHAAAAAGIAAVEDMFGSGVIASPGGAKQSRSERDCFVADAPRNDIMSACPSPIFTSPEIASVGLTAEELTAAGIAFRTGRFPYAASGKALCDGDPEGQAIVHADPQGRILGVHLIGREATTMIAEAALALRKGLTIRDIAETIHAHPTLPEVLAEGCEDAEGRAIHKGPVRRGT